MKKKCLILNNRESIPESTASSLADVLDIYWYQRPEESFSVVHAFREHPDTNIIIVTYMNLSAKTLSLLPNLEAIIATGTAIEYIDKDYCVNHDIAVFNTPSYTGTSVAEFAVGLMFTLTRYLAEINTQIRQGDFKCFNCCGTELHSKTAGIIGLGHIGSSLAEMLNGLGLRVIYHTRSPRNCTVATSTSLEALLGQSDIVFVTVSLNQETHHLLGSREFSLMKDQSFIISISPDDVLDIGALYPHLRSGRLRVALDLHSQHNELLDLPNLYLSPRRAWYTSEAFNRRIAAWRATLEAYLTGNPINQRY
jgi:phosphoglycerate dehydrogenase-like enzyme